MRHIHHPFFYIHLALEEESKVWQHQTAKTVELNICLEPILISKMQQNLLYLS